MYDGVRQLGPLVGGIRSCGLIACVTNDRRSCADRSSALKSASFTSIKISSVVPINKNTYYFPSTLQTSLTPILDYLYCNEELSAQRAKITMESVTEEENILSFGFYARVYERDHYLKKLNDGKLSGDDWMKIFIGAAAVSVVASVAFIFYAQRTDLKLKIT